MAAACPTLHTATLTDCTIGGNSAAAGGGLYNSSTAKLYACTISGNSAAVGGGIDNVAQGTATLEDTIVAANLGTGGHSDDVNGVNKTGVVGTYDLVGTGGAGGIAGGTGDIVLANLNALALAPLGSYGGPTQTMALLPGSVAIGAGTAIAGVADDQRGVTFGAKPDIGAFESQGFTLATVAGSTPQVVASGNPFPSPLAVTVTAKDPLEPVAGGLVTFAAHPATNGASAGPLGRDRGHRGRRDRPGHRHGQRLRRLLHGRRLGQRRGRPGHLHPDQPDPGHLLESRQSEHPLWHPERDPHRHPGRRAQAPKGQEVAVTLDGVTQNAVISSTGTFSTTFNSSGLTVSGSPYTLTYSYASDGTFTRPPRSAR